jgi:hypothetical protein
LQETAYENLKRHVLPSEVFPALHEERFNAAVQQTRLQCRHPPKSSWIKFGVDSAGARKKSRPTLCGHHLRCRRSKSKTNFRLEPIEHRHQRLPPSQ